MDGIETLDQLQIANRIPVRQAQIEAFCRAHKIRKMALFGSVLRDDFRPDSDIDLLVSFDECANHSLLGHIQMEQDLAAMFGRDVDMVEQEALEKPFVRHHIRHNHQTIYRTVLTQPAATFAIP